MSEDFKLDHKTFDLGAVLSGVGFPEVEVGVYFDEVVGYKLHKLKGAIQEAKLLKADDEEVNRLIEEYSDLKEASKGNRFEITVRGLPESARKIANAKARKKFPVEYSFLNQEIPDSERDDYYNALIWQESIVKITSPDGSVAVPTEDQILQLRSSVGRSVVSAISDAIRDLQDGAKSGYEEAAKDVSFLFDA